MITITADEIKKELAEKNACGMDCVRCSHCANWAYNNGGVITSVGSSRCKRQKQKTDSYQFCKGFELKK